MGWNIEHLADQDVVQVTAEGLHDRTMLRNLTRDAVMAGNNPTKSAVTTAIAVVNASTRPSGARSRRASAIEPGRL